MLAWVHHVVPADMFLLGETTQVPISIALVDEGLLPDLGIVPQVGRIFRTPDHERSTLGGRAFRYGGAAGQPVVLVSNRFWRSRLGSSTDLEHVVLQIADDPDGTSVNARVIGVMPEGINIPDARTDVWYPLARSRPGPTGRLRPQELSQLSFGPPGYAWGQTIPGTDARAAQDELRELFRRRLQDYPSISGLRAESSLIVTPFHRAVAGRVWPSLVLLAASSLLLVLLACGASGILLQSLQMVEGRATGIRYSLGATRGHEFVVVCIRVVLQAGLIMVLAVLVSRLLWTYVEPYVLDFLRVQSAPIDTRALVYGLTVAIVAAGLTEVPALVHTQMLGSRQALRLPGTPRLRKLTLGAGIGLCTLMLLLMCSFILAALRNLAGSHSYPDDTVIVTMDQRNPSLAIFGQPERERELMDRLAALSSVHSVAMANRPPELPSDRFFHMALPGTEPWRFDLRPISYGFFQTMQLELVEGRSFAPRDRTDRIPHVVVDTEFVRRFGGDAVGRYLDEGCDQPCEGLIVGVIRSVPILPEGRALPTVYVLTDQYARQSHYPHSRFALFLRPSADPITTIRDIRRILTDGTDGLAVRLVQTAGDLRATRLRDGVVLSRSLGVLGVISLILALMTCWGYVSHEAWARKRECAIKTALGASPRLLAWERARVSMSAIVVGVLAGVAGAFVGHQAVRAHFGWLGAVGLEYVALPALLSVASFLVCLTTASRAHHVVRASEIPYVGT